jgi:hypothetical protein
MRMRRYGRSICRSWLVFELSALLLAGGCLIEPKDAECAEATNCGDCLDRSGCGWCAPRGRCVPGTSTGPSDDLLDCESELEFISSGWRYSSCGSCAQNTNCVECQAESCTWCGDGAGYCVSASDDNACRNPFESRDGCGGVFTPDMGPTGGGCTNTCRDARDGFCDDGGPGADYSICALGTDCADCGPR